MYERASHYQCTHARMSSGGWVSDPERPVYIYVTEAVRDNTLNERILTAMQSLVSTSRTWVCGCTFWWIFEGRFFIFVLPHN